MKYLTILGSTGSIGVNTLNIIKNNPDKFTAYALVANKNFHAMIHQCLIFKPNYICMINEHAAKILKSHLSKIVDCDNIKVFSGMKAACELVAFEKVDTVVAAIVGIDGLLPTMAAIRAGKRILLTNKESLITCGKIFMREARKYKSFILPVDSEHNAIFQNLPEQFQHNLGNDYLIDHGISSIILTGSGGPFLNTPLSDLVRVTPEQACIHPNWSMGQKISVDSATMMNKGLEYIEARWLFNASNQEIEIILHPQSIIHSMVRYIDGSILSHLSKPDMKTHIAYAMSYPERISAGVSKLDFLNLQPISFLIPDNKRYPCLQLAIQASDYGQAATTVLNAANEVAVMSFLRREICFTDIAIVNYWALENLIISEPDTIEDILYIDNQVRHKIKPIIKYLHM